LVAIQAFVWLASIRIMAIAIILGPWLLMFEFFDRTRGFFQNWIGIVVGVWTFQFAASVFLQISMHSEMETLRNIQRASAASNSVDMMLSNLGRAAMSIFGDALTMLVLPAVFGGVSGAGAQIAAWRGMAAMPRMMAAATGRVGALKRMVHRA
jgi:hypothetical protein